jgi:hypothetical protein
MSIRRCRRLAPGVALLMAACLLLPAAAFAAGTGDDPTPTKDVLTRAEAKAKAVQDAKFQEWVARVKASDRAKGAQPAIVDAPYYYMWTPSHAQERTYWCGPATCQVISDWWGPAPSQASIAGLLGTTSSGTDFTKVDETLRLLTGKSYYYYGPLGTESAFMSHVGYGIVTKHYPMATDVHIHASVWPNYNFDHSGHIIPLEAYDGRDGTIRIDDPYNEASWQPGGGSTFGHKTYSHDVIWNGVYNHFRQAVVR